MLKFLEKNSQRGSILVFELLLIFVFSVGLLSLLGTATAQLRVIRVTGNREEAFQIAEAGANYYQWHLAHYSTDFQDGTGAAAPAQSAPLPANCYLHDYLDKDTEAVIGRYCLEITAPPVGSTIVTIKSTGYTTANPTVLRSVTTRYGIPSLAKYALVTNDYVWIGASSSVNGELHSNNGIRFDGTGNAPITSAKSTYSCPASQGSPCPATENGIWGSASAATQAFWNFPVPTVDFSTLTSDLATMKSDAQAAGIYLPPSNAQGYSLVFNSNGTVTVYKVTSLTAHATGYDVNGTAHSEDIVYNARALQFTQAIPANGMIYIEDRTWVEGTVLGRAMVVAAKLPYNAATAPSILIPTNILYAAKDGTNTLGLLGQQDVLLTYNVPNNLEIDAAIVAQNGSFQRYRFDGTIKTAITLYGSVMTFGRRVLYYVGLSGYPTISSIYDSSLLYSPPPSFPLTTSGYQQITWTSN